MDNDEKMKLLENFNPDFSSLDSYINEINFFRILRLENLEIRHSNFLSWLLDVNACHGIGDVFIKSFICSIIINNSTKINGIDIGALSQNFFQFTVNREHYFIYRGKPRSIDLLLVNTNNKILICIENKIKSKQHDGQLKAYKDYINNQSEFSTWNKIFIYLTPTNEETEDDDWIKIPYEYVLKSLEATLQKCNNIDQNVRFFIYNYISILRRDVMHTDEELRKKCLEIYNANKEVLDIIYAYKMSPLTQTILNVLNDAAANGKIDFLPTARQGNTEFRFSTSKLESIVPKDPQKINVWNTNHRILYRIVVFYADGAPKKVDFTAVLTGNQNNEFSKKVIDIVEQNHTFFGVKQTIKKGKDYTVVFRRDKFDVKDINDELLKSFKDRVEKFIEEEIKEFESKF